jgi:hypothetical protein
MAAHMVSDCIALQTYSELPPVFDQSTIRPLKVLFYDVGDFAFPYLLNPERWVQVSLNATKNCFLSKAKYFSRGCPFHTLLAMIL